MVSVFIAAGVKMVASEFRSKLLLMLVFLGCLIPVVVYEVLPEVARVVGLKLGTKRVLPYRDDYKFFLRPWKTGYRGAERFASEALDQVEKDAIIFADGTTVYPLLLAQETANQRKDVTIVSGHGSVDNMSIYSEDFIKNKWDQLDVYVISPVKGYCPEFLLDSYHFEHNGVLSKAVKK